MISKSHLKSYKIHTKLKLKLHFNSLRTPKSMNPTRITPLKSRPNQKGRAETEEKCYLDSFSTSPHLAGTSPPPETTELAGDEEKQREEDSHLGKEDKRK